MNPSIIRPGLLVSLRSTVRGGVSYQRRTIAPDTRDGSTVVASWETRREITDADEHARAVVARGAARTAIVRVCCASAFGLLCPQSREPELAGAIEEAEKIAAAFNATARFTRVEVFTLVGVIASDDAEAARAIGSEVRDLLDNMREAVASADVSAIREAAKKARDLSGMLSEDVRSKVSAAIAEVRGIARAIVKRAESVSETAAESVRSVQLSKLDAARFAVLDLGDEVGEPQSDVTALPAPTLDFGPLVNLAPEQPRSVSLEFAI